MVDINHAGLLRNLVPVWCRHSLLAPLLLLVTVVLLSNPCVKATTGDEFDSAATTVEQVDSVSTEQTDVHAARLAAPSSVASILDALQQLAQPGSTNVENLLSLSRAEERLLEEATPSSFCLLAFLHTFGVPITKVAGFPRDMQRAVWAVLKGMSTPKVGEEGTKYRGLCLTLQGFLVGAGHPGLTSATTIDRRRQGYLSLSIDYQTFLSQHATQPHAKSKRTAGVQAGAVGGHVPAEKLGLTVPQTAVTGESGRYGDGLNRSFVKVKKAVGMVAAGMEVGESPRAAAAGSGHVNDGLLSAARHVLEVDQDVDEIPRPAGLDAEANHGEDDIAGLAYWMAANSGDGLGALAYAFRVMHGLTWAPDFRPRAATRATTPPLPLHDVRNDSEGNYSFSSRCHEGLRALYGQVVPAARSKWSNDVVRSTVQYRVSKAAENLRDNRRKMHLVKAAAQMADPSALHEQARIEYQGDYGVNKAANTTQAVETWRSAAKLGHGNSAWILALLHIRGEIGDGNLSAVAPFLETVQNAKDTAPKQKAFAKHLQYRYGLGIPADPIEAGSWLVKSAELGDVNAQMMVGYVYSGLHSVRNVTIPSVVNGTHVADYQRALRFWRMAAAGGEYRAHLPIAASIISGNDPGLVTDEERCSQAYSHVHEVIFAGHPLVLALHALARRAFVLGDRDGALLLYSFLSDIGSLHAALNAADLWLARPTSAPPLELQCCAAGHVLLAEVCLKECALVHLRRAAALGNIDAMHRISAAEELSADGKAAAYAWTDRAAQRGDPRGIFERAMMHYAGIGVDDANGTATALEELWGLWAMGGMPARIAALLGIARIEAMDVASKVVEVQKLAPSVTEVATMLSVALSAVAVAVSALTSFRRGVVA